MTLSTLVLLAVCGLFGWLLWYQLALREFALRYARLLCEKQGVQLLDQSIGLAKMRVKRLTRGGWALEREYQFEFTSTGEHRYTGKLFMVAKTVQHFELEAFKEPSDLP